MMSQSMCVCVCFSLLCVPHSGACMVCYSEECLLEACVCVCVFNSMEFCVWGMGFRNPPDVDCQLWDQFSICASGKNKQEKVQENQLEGIGGLYG